MPIDRPGIRCRLAIPDSGARPQRFPGRRSATAERALVTYLACETYGYRGKELSDAMGYRDSSSVARSATRAEGSPALLRAWRKLAREVKAELVS